MPPWLEEAVDSSEEESRRFPRSHNVEQGEGKCLFTSRQFRLYFSDFICGEIDGYVNRQPSGTKTVHNRTDTDGGDHYDLY
jgi:hypothetical protein